MVCCNQNEKEKAYKESHSIALKIENGQNCRAHKPYVIHEGVIKSQWTFGSNFSFKPQIKFLRKSRHTSQPKKIVANLCSFYEK